MDRSKLIRLISKRLYCLDVSKLQEVYDRLLTEGDFTKKPSDRDLEILRLREEGGNMEAIGEQFGITKQRVSQVIQKWRGYEIKE